MNIHESLAKAVRLQGVKRKNEEQIPLEELQGKYKKAYEKLCGDLKEEQCLIRTWYMERTRKFAETLFEFLSQCIYADPDEQPRELLGISADLLEAFTEAWQIYMKYRDIRQEDEEAWAALTDEVTKLGSRYEGGLVESMARKVVTDLDVISRRRKNG